MQPLLTASDGAGIVLNALHVLTHLILQPLHEVETIIITPYFQMGKLNSREVNYPGPAHVTDE